MREHQLKNYLRSCRKKLGLTQEHLGFILGLGTGCRISALENERVRPNVEEIIAFRKLFGRWPEEMWPRWVLALETEIDSHMRRLMDRLQRTQVRSNRKRLRDEFILRCLERILEGLPAELPEE